MNETGEETKKKGINESLSLYAEDVDGSFIL